MKWFKHDSDARNSLKLRKVRRKFGAEGYAVYWYCLEAIAYKVDKDCLTFELEEDSETIGFELNIQERRVEEIMRYLIDVKLFESSDGIITCLKLAERIDKSMTNSPSMRKWLDNKSVMTSNDKVMTNDDKVSSCAELEVDKIRLEKKKIKIKRNTFSFPENEQLEVVEFWNDLNPKFQSHRGIAQKALSNIKKCYEAYSKEAKQNERELVSVKEWCIKYLSVFHDECSLFDKGETHHEFKASLEYATRFTKYDEIKNKGD